MGPERSSVPCVPHLMYLDMVASVHAGYVHDSWYAHRICRLVSSTVTVNASTLVLNVICIGAV